MICDEALPEKAHSDLKQALDRMLKVLKNLNDSLHVVGLKGFPVGGGGGGGGGGGREGEGGGKGGRGGGGGGREGEGKGGMGGGGGGTKGGGGGGRGSRKEGEGHTTFKYLTVITLFWS